MVIGKKVVSTTRVILGAIEKPIHKTNRGAIAIVGIVWVITSIGYTALYKKSKRSIKTAITKASAVPISRP